MADVSEIIITENILSSAVKGVPLPRICLCVWCVCPKFATGVWFIQPCYLGFTISTALSAYYHVKILFQKVNPCHIQPGFLTASEIMYSVFCALMLLPSKIDFFSENKDLSWLK